MFSRSVLVSFVMVALSAFSVQAAPVAACPAPQVSVSVSIVYQTRTVTVHDSAPAATRAPWNQPAQPPRQSVVPVPVQQQHQNQPQPPKQHQNQPQPPKHQPPKWNPWQNNNTPRPQQQPTATREIPQPPKHTPQPQQPQHQMPPHPPVVVVSTKKSETPRPTPTPWSPPKAVTSTRRQHEQAVTSTRRGHGGNAVTSTRREHEQAVTSTRRGHGGSGNAATSTRRPHEQAVTSTKNTVKATSTRRAHEQAVTSTKNTVKATSTAKHVKSTARPVVKTTATKNTVKATGTKNTGKATETKNTAKETGTKNTIKATETKNTVKATATGKAEATASVSVSASASASGSAAPPAVTGGAGAGGNNNNKDPQESLELDPRVIARNFAKTGQETPAAGQVESLTSTNNFINFCAGFKFPIMNGKQIETGTCNPAPMGIIPAQGKMPSSKFVFPRNFQTVKEREPFTIQMKIKNLDSGNFVNAAANYFAAPQFTNAGGIVVGHSHVVIEKIESLTSTKVLKAQDFVFFKGLNGVADGNGILSAFVDKGLPAGTYKLSSINSAANHQPVLLPVAQHGSADDAIYFTVAA